MSSPFEIRGVIEGFYGVYYTFEERNDLIRFIGRNGYNLYIYGPKNDRQHRARWREPYPQEIMDRFAENVAVAKESGVTFCYSIGPGVSMSYSSEEDLNIIYAKFRSFYERGVRCFSLLLDDISSKFSYDADRRAFGSYAEAHASVCNILFNRLKALDPECTLSMCPTAYHGKAPFGEYLHELGEKLLPDIDIFYTGPEVCSPQITASDAAAFARAARRKPIIWDNYPVNDLDMKAEMHIGPIQGREDKLCRETRGIVVNTMIQAEASKVSLLTYADYFRDPSGYDAPSSWRQALEQIAGSASLGPLLLFSENSLFSCLNPNHSEKLERLAGEALASLLRGENASDNAAVEALNQYVTSLDEACYHLKNRMANTALRNNLLPWIELMEHWHWMMKRALAVLQALEHGHPYESPLNLMKESLEEIGRHPKKIMGQVLMPLADYVLDRVKQDELRGGKGHDRCPAPQ